MSSRPLDVSTVTPPLGDQHDSTIIMLHGSGDSGLGLKEWLEMEGNLFRFERTKVIFPTAHWRPYSLLGPYGTQRVWFDRLRLDPTGKEDLPGMKEMAGLVKDVIQSEVDGGIPLSRIVLGGFSMGGGQALFTAISDDELCSGLV
eukprot:767617-Hanusia_phi.AAC.9